MIFIPAVRGGDVRLVPRPRSLFRERCTGTLFEMKGQRVKRATGIVPGVGFLPLPDLSFTRCNHFCMMRNVLRYCSAGLLVIAFLLGAGCTQPAPASSSSAPPQAAIVTPVSVLPVVNTTPRMTPTREDLVAFVQEAVAYAQANGKEKALAEFSNRNGSFFRGVLYIYAYDYNGTTIAHPVNPEKIGVNRLDEPDAEGTLFIRNLREAAYNGTGFSTYTYVNPVHNNTIEKKLGYVMKVDDTWWLGSGIYLGPADSTPQQSVSPAGANLTPASPGK